MTFGEILQSAPGAQVEEARDWASDCLFLADRRVSAERGVRYVLRHYPGGWTAFVAECCTPVVMGA